MADNAIRSSDPNNGRTAWTESAMDTGLEFGVDAGMDAGSNMGTHTEMHTGMEIETNTGSPPTMHQNIGAALEVLSSQQKDLNREAADSRHARTEAANAYLAAKQRVALADRGLAAIKKRQLQLQALAEVPEDGVDQANVSRLVRPLDLNAVEDAVADAQDEEDEQPKPGKKPGKDSSTFMPKRKTMFEDGEDAIGLRVARTSRNSQRNPPRRRSTPMAPDSETDDADRTFALKASKTKKKAKKRKISQASTQKKVAEEAVVFDDDDDDDPIIEQLAQQDNSDDSDYISGKQRALRELSVLSNITLARPPSPPGAFTDIGNVINTNGLARLPSPPGVRSEMEVVLETTDSARPPSPPAARSEIEEVVQTTELTRTLNPPGTIPETEEIPETTELARPPSRGVRSETAEVLETTELDAEILHRTLHIDDTDEEEDGGTAINGDGDGAFADVQNSPEAHRSASGGLFVSQDPTPEPSRLQSTTLMGDVDQDSQADLQSSVPGIERSPSRSLFVSPEPAPEPPSPRKSTADDMDDIEQESQADRQASIPAERSPSRSLFVSPEPAPKPPPPRKAKRRIEQKDASPTRKTKRRIEPKDPSPPRKRSARRIKKADQASQTRVRPSSPSTLSESESGRGLFVTPDPSPSPPRQKKPATRRTTVNKTSQREKGTNFLGGSHLHISTKGPGTIEGETSVENPHIDEASKARFLDQLFGEGQYR